MILGFKTMIKGKPTHFVQKILACTLSYYREEFTPKIHSIRAGERWKPGMTIHMATGVRTKEYSRFNGDGIGLDKCKSVQLIRIKYENKDSDYPIVWIDNKEYRYYERHDFIALNILAVNDGFDSFDQFCKWFSSDFEGQIIHWTDFKYK